MKKILFLIGLLYITFIYMDLNNNIVVSNIIKYICILLCFSISLLTGKNALNKKDITLRQFGLFLTLIADLCLLIFDFFITGLIFFCVVQITYTIRYNIAIKKILIQWFLIMFMTILIINSAADLVFGKIDFLPLSVSFYAVCLLISVWSSVYACLKNNYPKPNNILIVSGMIFFLLCDLNVGLSNAIDFMNNPGDSAEKIAHISRLLIWVFYLPSQVLLSLSGFNFKKSKPWSTMKGF
jgi:hypothetical protein